MRIILGCLRVECESLSYVSLRGRRRGIVVRMLAMLARLMGIPRNSKGLLRIPTQKLRFC